MREFEIGDVVKIVDAELRYCTFSRWFESNNGHIPSDYLIRYAYDDRIEGDWFYDREFVIIGIDTSGDYENIYLVREKNGIDFYHTFLFRSDGLTVNKVYYNELKNYKNVDLDLIYNNNNYKVELER